MSLLSEYCSVCGEIKPHLKSVYSESSLQLGTGMKLNFLLSKVLSMVPISNANVLCSDCEMSVHHFYKFCDMIQNVQKKLTLILPNEGAKLEQESSLNLCHTTGITYDSEPVIIKISLVRLINCNVCKSSLDTSQLRALHEVTHGLGSVLCECEQCGHLEEISSFLHDRNNVLCPQCSLRKLHTVDVQTQFQGQVRRKKKNSNENKTQNRSAKDAKVSTQIQMPLSSQDINDWPAQNVTCDYSDRTFHHSDTYAAICSKSVNTDAYSTGEENYNIPSTHFLSNAFEANQFSEHLGSFNEDLSPPSPSNTEDFSDNGNSGEHFLSLYNMEHLNTSDHSDSSMKFTQSKKKWRETDLDTSPKFTKQKKFSCMVRRSINSGSEPSKKYTRNKVHICETCSFVTSHKGHLKRHMLVHDKSIRPFLCDECGRSFNQKSSLGTHFKTQHATGAAKINFSCVVCGQVYKHKTSLWSHLLNNHNVSTSQPRMTTKFHCTLCDRYFITSTRLANHLKVHKNRRLVDVDKIKNCETSTLTVEGEKLEILGPIVLPKRRKSQIIQQAITI